MLPAAAAMALPAAAGAPAADAQVRNGTIAFSAKRGGDQVVQTRNPRRGGGRRLVGGSTHPAFSPAGRRLAFRRFGAGGAQIWITYLDGTRMRRLTRSRADDHSPSWSPADRIAFVRRTRGGDRVYVVPAGGGRAWSLTRGRRQEAFPVWSPTGRTLLVARGRRGRRDLYLVRADGSRSRRLTRVPGDESEPAWSPDGSRVVFVHRRGARRQLYLMKLRGRPVARLPARSRRVRRLASSRSSLGWPSWQRAGADPVVAAAGDIACDPLHPRFNGGAGRTLNCRHGLTSDLLMRFDLSSILIPGDVQYEDGALWKFERSFHPTWGRFKHLIRPVPGNHEYRIPGAAGYFDYFNGPGVHSGPAGERGKGYYSFGIGGWHVVALNSECRAIGGCGEGSPQEQWLRQDLAIHPARCTLAFFHHPRFTSGRHGAEDDVVGLWNALYEGGADLMLNGHEHFYERFAPQTPSGIIDPERGIRQLTVGMGGRNLHGFVTVAPNSEHRDNRNLGVVKLTLRSSGYDWELVRAPNGARTDSGSGDCH